MNSNWCWVIVCTGWTLGIAFSVGVIIVLLLFCSWTCDDWRDDVVLFFALVTSSFSCWIIVDASESQHLPTGTTHILSMHTIWCSTKLLRLPSVDHPHLPHQQIIGTVVK